MQQAVDTVGFLSRGSATAEELDEQQTASSRTWQVTLEIIGLIALSSFGTWPGVIYLFFVAITSSAW